jgi:hypothetical protein
MKKMLTREEYERMRSDFFKQQDAPKGSGFAYMMGWGSKIHDRFIQMLNAENLGYETDVNDDYTVLRDTPAMQQLFGEQPSWISRARYELLLGQAISEAFEDKSYLNEVHPNAYAAFVTRCRETLSRILNDRGIKVK